MMKRYLLAATMSVAMVATPALADGNNRSTDTETFKLRANNPAKCNLEAPDYTLALPNNSISNDNGRALRNVSNAVAREMNGAGVRAWCTGSSNSLQMYRTAFTTGDGNQTTDGFNQAVVYDVTMRINGATRSDGFDPIEGTADGQGNGPGVGVGSALTVSRFGPSGRGARVTFQREEGSEAVTDGGSNGTGPRSAFTADNNRLVAGTYRSELTIEVTPGV